MTAELLNGQRGGQLALATRYTSAPVKPARDPRRCGEHLDAPGTQPSDLPSTVFDELLDEIRRAIVEAPRSLQRRIGPSEFGEECERALIHKLIGDDEPDNGKVAFKAWVGTAMHAELEKIFDASICNTHPVEGKRFLLEQKVTVGHINGVPLRGSCDLFDTWTGTVVDWKSKGKTTLDGHRRHGASAIYKVQAQGYGLGMQNEGHVVRHVMDVFIPRDGEFRDIIYWAAPFDPQVPLAAIARCEGLLALVEAYGVNETINMYAPCNDRYCAWCPTKETPRANRRGPLPSTKSLLGITA